MPHFVERALDGSSALDDLTRDLNDRAAVPILMAAGPKPLEEFRHQGCSSVNACLRLSSVRLPPLMMATTFLPASSSRIWCAAAIGAAPAPSAMSLLVSNNVSIDCRNSESVTRRMS